MIVHPKLGQRVVVWYRASVRDFMPHHGKIGTVVIVAKGRGPRNHGVRFDDGISTVVPCGNIRPPQAGSTRGPTTGRFNFGD